MLFFAWKDATKSSHLLRLEDELDELAHGTVPTRIVRLQDGHLTHFLHGVGDSSGETDLPHDGRSTRSSPK